jgi:peptidoglycan/LPS O-acetylase OafA/YrhL
LYENEHRWWSIFYRTDTRADSILWGALLAHIWMRRKEPKRGIVIAGWVAAAFLLACLPFATQEGPFVYWGGFLGIDLACAVLILAILDGRWGGRHLFELKPFVALGMVSYGFYLWHLPVFFAVRFYDQHWNDVVRVIVAVSVTLTLTLLSWFLIERPLMNWSKRLEARRYIGSPTTKTMVGPEGALASAAPPGGSAAEEMPGSETNAETFGATEHQPP